MPKMTIRRTTSHVPEPLQSYAWIAQAVNPAARAIKGNATKAQVCRFNQLIMPPQPFIDRSISSHGWQCSLCSERTCGGGALVMANCKPCSDPQAALPRHSCLVPYDARRRHEGRKPDFRCWCKASNNDHESGRWVSYVLLTDFTYKDICG